ncbi:MAG: hypothetical protein Q9208_000018 [Pyrenodesmia sp. 3 TL-2023]
MLPIQERIAVSALGGEGTEEAGCEAGEEDKGWGFEEEKKGDEEKDDEGKDDEKDDGKEDDEEKDERGRMMRRRKMLKKRGLNTQASQEMRQLNTHAG